MYLLLEIKPEWWRMMSEYVQKSFCLWNNPQKSNFGPQNWIVDFKMWKFWTSKLKTQHLVINLDQGPRLKCAPGHDSMNASIIIKSDSLKSGVMQNQNFYIWFLDFFTLQSISEKVKLGWEAPTGAFVPEE